MSEINHNSQISLIRKTKNENVRGQLEHKLLLEYSGTTEQIRVRGEIAQVTKDLPKAIEYYTAYLKKEHDPQTLLTIIQLEAQITPYKEYLPKVLAHCQNFPNSLAERCLELVLEFATSLSPSPLRDQFFSLPALLEKETSEVIPSTFLENLRLEELNAKTVKHFRSLIQNYDHETLEKSLLEVSQIEGMLKYLRNYIQTCAPRLKSRPAFQEFLAKHLETDLTSKWAVSITNQTYHMSPVAFVNRYSEGSKSENIETEKQIQEDYDTLHSLALETFCSASAEQDFVQYFETFPNKVLGLRTLLDTVRIPNIHTLYYLGNLILEEIQDHPVLTSMFRQKAAQLHQELLLSPISEKTSNALERYAVLFPEHLFLRKNLSEEEQIEAEKEILASEIKVHPGIKKGVEFLQEMLFCILDPNHPLPQASVEKPDEKKFHAGIIAHGKNILVGIGCGQLAINLINLYKEHYDRSDRLELSLAEAYISVQDLWKAYHFSYLEFVQRKLFVASRKLEYALKDNSCDTVMRRCEGIFKMFDYTIVFHQKYFQSHEEFAAFAPPIRGLRDVRNAFFKSFSECMVLLLNNEHKEQAIDYMNRYMDLPMGSFHHKKQLCHTLFHGGFYKEAIPYFEDFLNDDSENRSMEVNLLGWCFLKNQNYSKAIELIESYLEVFPNDFNIRKCLIMSHHYKGDFARAHGLATDLLQNYPEQKEESISLLNYLEKEIAEASE